MKTLRLFPLLLVFAVLPLDLRSVRAQQPDDDPNWRERQLEKLQKEFQELEKRAETLRKQFEALERELEISMNKLPMTRRSRWLDRWDYRPMFPQLQI